MTFTEALSAVFNDGDRIRRPIWHSAAHVTINNYALSINGYMQPDGTWVNDGQYRAWDITEQDYYADDWEVVE